ncbi:related to choline kinase [Rhynchosporium agropyri]|uniref:Related to choline kinase n=1 Tax=Rhynchosporium agropyri TaxID=914238 RepID=A0A1E1KYH7_9HELO|nr:related to choline kinase [Rhynchosporium agropyri]
MSSTPSEKGSALPLRPALKEEQPMSPNGGPVKFVSIAAEPESIPLLSGSDDSSRPKQFRAGVSERRMTGRPNTPTSSSKASLQSQGSIEDPQPASDASSAAPGKHHKFHSPLHRGHHEHRHDKLLSQVAEWLQAEKAKRAAKKAHGRGDDLEDIGSNNISRPRTSSQSSDGSTISLEKLQQILEDNMSSFGLDSLPVASTPAESRRPSQAPRRRSSARKMYVGSSDTEYQDGDAVVPSCDAVLDNSKTMSYSGGKSESAVETVTLSTSKRAEKERKAWATFKGEILRLAHTLRLKGWRRVPLERGGDIEVKRLSGALTNAVYVVSPPDDLPTQNSNGKPYTPKPPPKLLLRIYGPQVEHLIDRENELSILRRLARKKIGPRLLGTFTNGRFEEYFNAEALTFADLRDQGTSKQIAKRMRELHDGIELLNIEIEEGPFVWLNWDKWVNKCEKVISYLDQEILGGQGSKDELWQTRGLICGVEWPQFKAAVDKYRKWLDSYYGKGGVNRHLVFAHNDTQYGNILRVVPEKPSEGSAPSPLLLPENRHKQLIVIDFEYSSANTPGLEFANHFTEWCYNYHDAIESWCCNTQHYPTLEQQTTFIRSYINHRPQFNPRASATPKMHPLEHSSRNSISDFYLDSRTPGGSTLDLTSMDYNEEEARREQETERQVQALLKEVRIWRVANSAQWVAWGIVQAVVPGLEQKTEADAPSKDAPEVKEDGDKASEGDDDEEFDYLRYAQDRALFFWGDVISLGIVDKADLPEELLKKIKIVEY